MTQDNKLVKKLHNITGLRIKGIIPLLNMKIEGIFFIEEKECVNDLSQIEKVTIDLSQREEVERSDRDPGVDPHYIVHA